MNCSANFFSGFEICSMNLTKTSQIFCVRVDTEGSQHANCSLLFDCIFYSNNLCKCQCTDHESSSPEKCGVVDVMQCNCTNTKLNAISGNEVEILPLQDENTSNSEEKWIDLLPNRDLQNISTISDMDLFRSKMLLQETLVTDSSLFNRNVTTAQYSQRMQFSFSVKEKYTGTVIYDRPLLPIWVLAMLACIGVIILIAVTLSLYY